MASTTHKSVLCAQIIKDDFSRFLSYMPNPDTIASGSISSYETYRQMKDDPRIKSLLNMLKTSALNFPQRLVQSEGVRDEVFAFVKSHAVFTRKLYQKAKRVLSALDYGFSVTEAVWKIREDGKYLLDNLITRKSDRFVFDHDWNCYWNRSGEKVLLNHKHKWLQFQHDPDDENPYGTSELRCVYWPYLFKKAGFEFWLMATEKFAVKSIIALFDLTGSEDDIRERAVTIADLLESVQSGSASALANIKDLKEVGTNGSVSEFAALVDACDVQIAYGISGQAVATNNPDKGTQALGTVGADILYGKASGIALELQTVLQKAVNWVVELNYGKNEKVPALEFDVEQKASFADVMSAVDRGVPVSLSKLYDKYNIPKPKDREDSFIHPAQASFDLSDADPSGKKKRPRIVIQ